MAAEKCGVKEWHESGGGDFGANPSVQLTLICHPKEMVSALAEFIENPHGRGSKSSQHPNPTTKIGSKMGGEFTYQPKWDPKTVLTTTAKSRATDSRRNRKARPTGASMAKVMPASGALKEAAKPQEKPSDASSDCLPR